MPKDLDVVIDNIGIPPSTNLAYSDNVTLSSGDGEILVSLKSDHEVATKEYIRRLRQVLPEKFPDCSFYFQPGDMMNQILNFGLPAPIDVKIIGGDYKNFHLAKQIEARMKRIAGAVDVHVHQIMNQPALRVEVDRTRAAQLGFSQREIAENFLIASSSSVVVTPNYWNDPKTGRPYQVVVVQPHETALNSVEAVLNIPLPGKGQSPDADAGQRGNGQACRAAGDHQSRQYRTGVRRVRERAGQGSRCGRFRRAQGRRRIHSRRRASRRTTPALKLPARRRACTTPSRAWESA